MKEQKYAICGTDPFFLLALVWRRCFGEWVCVIMKCVSKILLAPGTRCLSAKQFSLRLLGYWIYTVCWLGALVWIAFFWQASFLVKCAMLMVLVVGTPTVRDLFHTYAEYTALWKESNEQRTSSSCTLENFGK